MDFLISPLIFFFPLTGSAELFEKAKRIQSAVSHLSSTLLPLRIQDGKSPVSDVELRIQHILDDSSIDASFGEFMLTTATLGTVSTEIRVADAVNWYSPTQQFYVTPAKCSGTWVGDNFDTRTCNGILHSFEPEVELTELKHLFEGITEFTDITSFAIKGYVIYGESLNSSSYRPEYDAGDWDTSTCPTMFGSQCYCPVESAPVSLVLEKLEDKELMSDEDGYFAETAGYGEGVVFSFKGYQGHTFELWNVTGGTFSDDLSSLTFELLDVSTTPSVNFTANDHSFFVLVDVRERNLLVRIQGGDEAIGVRHQGTL